MDGCASQPDFARIVTPKRANVRWKSTLVKGEVKVMHWKDVKGAAMLAVTVVVLGGGVAMTKLSVAGEPHTQPAMDTKDASANMADNLTVSVDGCRLTTTGQQISIGRFAGRGALLPDQKSPVFNSEAGITVFLSLDNAAGDAQRLQWRASLRDATGKEIPLRPDKWQSQCAQVDVPDARGGNGLRPWDGSVAKGDKYTLRLLFFVDTKDLGVDAFSEDSQGPEWKQVYQIVVKFKGGKDAASTLTTTAVKPVPGDRPRLDATRTPPPSTP